jgi:cytochrome c-type biogenesis protein CcmH/NrfF
VSLAAIALIWATPAIALCAVAWLIEQLLRARELAPPPPAPAVASTPPPPPAAG